MQGVMFSITPLIEEFYFLQNQAFGYLLLLHLSEKVGSKEETLTKESKRTISPFLFLIGAEFFSRLINREKLNHSHFSSSFC
jgi:hypothetical protein